MTHASEKTGILHIALEPGAALIDALDHPLLSQAADQLPLGFSMHDEQGALSYVNRHLARLLGYDASDVIGLPVCSLVAPDDRAAFQECSRSMKGADPFTTTLVGRDGGLHRYFIAPTACMDEEGTYLGGFSIYVSPGEVVGAPHLSNLDPAPGRSRTTDRERQIIGELMDGLSVGEIALALCISPHTVRNHIKSAYRKLGVHSRVELFKGLLEEISSARRRVDQKL